MKKILYIYKLLSTKNGKKRIAFFLPWLGISIGTMMLLLVDGIMSGMEKEIFTSLNKIEKEYQIESISNSNFNDILNYLNDKDYDYEVIYNRDVIISAQDHYMLVNMIANENLLLKDNIIIGAGISHELKVDIGDSVFIFSPLDIKFSSMKIPNVAYLVDSIYYTPVVDFDRKNIFVNFSSIKNLINSDKKILINEPLSKLELAEIENQFTGINVSFWKDNYLELISAIKLEKIMYSVFAYMLILLSCLGNFTISNFIITNKLREISILNILGFVKSSIKSTISLIMVFFTLLSSVFGVFIFNVLLWTKAIDPLISILFPHNLFYNFFIDISIANIIIILVLNTVTVYLSSLIAINTIKKNEPINIIRGNQV